MLFILEQYIQISKINDFIFCPKSVYLHRIYENFDQNTYHQEPQKVGKLNHENIDSGKYSTAKKFLQGMPVYCNKYEIAGKIDIYDSETKTLIERKTKIKKIYDGYKYQLYAQYFSLIEMGYAVNKMFIHSLNDNKRYEIPIPNKKETEEFGNIIDWIRRFDVLKHKPKVVKAKCDNCIYSNLC